jgi:dihydrofolate reductase
MTFTGHVFLGMSVDGFIARDDDSLDFLSGSGEGAGDAGFTPFVDSIDALLMGRGTYDVIAGEQEWPYQGKPLHLLSTTVADDADPRVAAVHRTADDAIAALDDTGYRRVYVDGGRTVRELLARGRIQTLTLSRVPVLIGSGASLFGPLPRDVELEHVSTEVLGGGMVQTTYRVRESLQAESD